MKRLVLRLLRSCFQATVLLSAYSIVAQSGPDMPHLRKQGRATQLIVEGKPFLMLGGELGNSSTSNMDYMKPMWPKLKQMHLNTVLAPIYWELLEPQEGKFDFTIYRVKPRAFRPGI